VRAKKLYLLAGPSGHEKSWMAGVVAMQAALAGQNVLYISLEMSAEEMAGRWGLLQAGVNVETDRAALVASEKKSLLKKKKFILLEQSMRSFIRTPI
jgi:KaiC/GvpD/RAD55 family RecA-like ATPase